MNKLTYPWLEPSFARLLRDRERLHHGLLLAGPAGIGKTGLALELAAALLCESPGADGRACGRCAACGWFAQGNHPDFRLLTPQQADEAKEGASGKPAKPSREIKIDQVRALDTFVGVGSHRGHGKIVLVDPADALNVPAANALLKTLEEPPPATRFLLVTSRPEDLPATVRSRCSRVDLPVPDAEQAVAWLVAETGAEPPQARLWLAAAGGSPLRARAFAEPATATAHRTVVDALARLPETSPLQAAEALSGVEPRIWIELLQAWTADLARVAGGAAPRFFPDREERLRALAARSSLQRIVGFDRELGQIRRTAEHPLNPRLASEDAMLRYGAIFAG